MNYNIVRNIEKEKISIFDYIVLQHIANNTAEEFLKDEEYNIDVEILHALEYISDNYKLTLKGKELLDRINSEENVKSEDFYINLHKKLQDKLVNLTGKKQKILGGKYSFLCNAKDLKIRLNKVIKHYSLTDLEKIERILLNYITKCHNSNWSFAKLIEYYIFKDGGSQLATDYENFNDKEEISINNEGTISI